MKIGEGLFGMFLMLAPAVAQAESYFCKADLSTGFKWSEPLQRWNSVDFNAADVQFVLAADANDQSEYIATYLGEQSPRHRCKRTFLNGVGSPQMVCGGLGFGLIVNFKSLRYQEVYTFGFVDGEDKNGNDPGITIGRCVKIGS